MMNDAKKTETKSMGFFFGVFLVLIVAFCALVLLSNKVGEFIFGAICGNASGVSTFAREISEFALGLCVILLSTFFLQVFYQKFRLAWFSYKIHVAKQETNSK